MYIVYLKKKDLTKAEKYIKKLLNFNSTDYYALRDLGYLYFLKNNIKEAKLIFEKIKKKINNDVFALNIYGLINYSLDNLDVAINLFISAINLDPKYIDSYNNLGKIYFDLEDLEKALNIFRKAYKLNKKSPKTLINIGNILSLKDKNQNAITAYKKALNNQGQKSDILANISIAYSRIRNFDNALKYYKEAIEYNSNNSSLKLSTSYLYLYKNKFLDAWKLFDSRLQNTNFFKKKYNKEIISYILKDSQEFDKNDKILILREQGIGEEILFSSMYSDLITYSKNVTIETDARLINIFERSFNKKVFYADGTFSKNIDSLKKFDSIIFAGSLCKKFRNKLSDFHKKEYLFSDIKKDKEISQVSFLNNTNLKVGISWKSIVSIYGKLKSLDLNDFKELFTTERQIINLQYGDTKNEIKKINNSGFNIYSFDEIDLFNDLDSCMSILKNIDVFVTVSNSTAHIAAAMGVKTILICPKQSSTYFYWSNENKLTPWYKSVTILRINGSIKKTMNEIDNILNNI